jgi:hypothetical protein
LDNVQSFALTRASMLRLLARSSFTSMAELLDPAAGESDAPWFAAFKGRRVALATAPQANADPTAEWPEPEGLATTWTTATPPKAMIDPTVARKIETTGWTTLLLGGLCLFVAGSKPQHPASRAPE